MTNDLSQINKFPRITKEELGMMTAFSSSLRSEDPDTKVGSCVMNKDGRIIATGFNGLRAGQLYNFSWTREEKLLKMCHAECNALSLIRRGEGQTIYCTVSPCPACCQNIIAHGIKTVVYYQEYHRNQDFREIFDEAGVYYKRIRSEFIDNFVKFLAQEPSYLTEKPL